MFICHFILALPQQEIQAYRVPQDLNSITVVTLKQNLLDHTQVWVNVL